MIPLGTRVRKPSGLSWKHTAPVFQEITMHDDIGADSIEEWGGDILPIKDDITEGHGG